MTKFSLLSVFLFFFSGLTFGQLNQIHVKLTDDMPKPGSVKLYKSATAPKACKNDTIGYARIKTTAYNSISVRKNYSLGQFYPAPQDITVYGFSFFGWAVASPPNDKKLRLICNLYKAGTDSLPSGSPLRSDTVTVDSTFGGGLLSKLEKHANFKTPITLDYAYVLTIESDSTGLSGGLVANSWANKDGRKENLLCGSVSGKWYRGLSLNISGANLDADMQFYPHVSYSLGTNFTFNDCSDFKDTVRFKNEYQKNVSGSKFYNYYSYYKLDWYCHQWNYGDLPWNYAIENGKNKYTGKGNYKVRLISYVYQWRGNTPCVDTTTKVIYFKPSNPTAKNTNICRGDDANIVVSSDTGTTIKWYRNKSGSPVNTGTSYNLGKIQKNDTLYVKAINNDCESNFTDLYITVNDYPKNPSIADDSICLNAKANLEAISSTGVTEWYLDSTKLPFYNGNVFQTQSLSQSQTYFVRSNNNGCYSSQFKKITAHVDNSFAPAEPIVTKDTSICFRPLGKAVLKAYSKDNDSLRWYLNAGGGTSIARGNEYTLIPSTTGITTIYVEAQKSTCASSRLGISVTVNDYPSISKVFGDEKCVGDTGQVAVLLSGQGDVNWYTQASGGAKVGKSTAILYFTNKSITLYAEAINDACVNPVRSAVPIVMNAYDSITKVDVPLVCGNAKVTMKVFAGTNVVKWYADEEAKVLLANASSYTTPALLVSTNYYFTVEKNGCKSPVNKVFAEVLPLPVAGYNYSFIPGHRLSLVPQETNGLNYLWKMGDGNTYTTKYVTHKYTTYGTFEVKLIATSITSGCKDSASQNILYDFSGIKPIQSSSIILYPNPSDGSFVLKMDRDLSFGKLSILAMDGKLVHETQLMGLSELEINNRLPAGIYTVRIESKGKIGTARLIVR